MANIIDSTFFFGELDLPQLSQAANANGFQWLIDEHEPRMLTDLLGYTLYKNFLAGITVGDQKYKDIRDGLEYTNRYGILTKWRGLSYTLGSAKKSPIANYVYYQYMNIKISSTTGTGEANAKTQNATSTSPILKMVAAWNEMVKMNLELMDFLLTKQSTYPEFVLYYNYPALRNLLTSINAHGI